MKTPITIPKRTSDKLAHVVLSIGDRNGWGFDTKKQRYFVSYTDAGRYCQEFLPKGATEEECRAERERRYTELAMLGARFKNEEEPRPETPPKEKKDKDYGVVLIEWTVRKRVWRVLIRGVFYGKYKTAEEARAVRDRVLKEQGDEHRLKPCALCGQKPTFFCYYANKRWMLEHKCPEGNSVLVKRLGREPGVALWNLQRRLGKGVKTVEEVDV